VDPAEQRNVASVSDDPGGAAVPGFWHTARPVRRPGNRSAIALALLAAGIVLASAMPATARDRPPSKSERAAIKRVAMKVCGGATSPSNPCRFHGARVSTRNARFVWANVTGEGFSGALLKRPAPGSRRFKVIGTQGGGIGECSYWRSRAPAAVLRDLRISGVVDDSGDVRNCGRRG
jgi:hypothetical protein